MTGGRPAAGGRGDGASLVTVAHGTRNQADNRVAVEVTAAAGARLGIGATASYVELCDPLFADVVAGLDGAAVVVPLLLSTGYHVTKDLPAAVATATVPIALGGAFGPDPLLAAAQVDRLVEAGAAPGQPLVLVAAGSTDAAALDDLAAAAGLLADAWGGEVRLATLGGLGPRPAEVVRPGDAVSPYLLSPGHFARRAAEESRAAGAAVVADVIGTHPRVVDLLVARAERMTASLDVGP